MTIHDPEKHIRKLRRENASLRNRLRAAGNAEKIRSIHMSQNPDQTPEQLRERIEHLEHALTIQTLKADQYRHVIVDHYGFDVDNPPTPQPSSPMRELSRTLGHVITATFPGDLEEGPDGPIGMSPTQAVTAPVLKMTITSREAIANGIDPTTPGLRIVDHDGEIIRDNPLEEN